MKTRKIVKTRINNEVIIEQLQNGRCTLARGIETIYHFTFDVCELTKDGYFKIQWHVQEF